MCSFRVWTECIEFFSRCWMQFLLMFFLDELESTSSLSFHYSEGRTPLCGQPFSRKSHFGIASDNSFKNCSHCTCMTPWTQIWWTKNTCTLVVQKPGFGCVSGMVSETNWGGGNWKCIAMYLHYGGPWFVPVAPVVSAAWAGSRNSLAFRMLCNMLYCCRCSA